MLIFFFLFFCSFFNSTIVLGVFSFFVLFFFFLFKGSYLVVFFFMVFDGLSYVLIFLSLWIGAVLYLILFKYKNNLFSMSFMMSVNHFLIFFLILSFSFLNLLGFYIFFEVSLIPLILLILLWGYQVERIQASFYLLLYTMFGSLPLLMMLVFFLDFYSLNWMTFGFVLNSGVPFMGLVVFLFAFFIKLPLYGLHLWLPKAHVEAPVGGSMILAAVLLKLGGYGVFRVMFFFTLLQWVLSVLIMLCLWGAFLSSLVCARLSDMKALVAYSSVSHMGVMMSGFFLNSSLGVKGGLVMMMGHGFCSSALFYLVNFHYERSMSRQSLMSRGYLGVYFVIPIFWFLFLIINFAAPPFLNLFGELLIFLSANKSFLFVVLMGVISFTVAYYCVLLYSIISHGHLFKFLSVPAEMDMFFLILSFHFLPLFMLVFKMNFFF